MQQMTSFGNYVPKKGVATDLPPPRIQEQMKINQRPTIQSIVNYYENEISLATPGTERYWATISEYGEKLLDYDQDTFPN